MEMTAPNRAMSDRDREALIRKDAKGSRTDAPKTLPLASLKEAPSLFQPRHDSVAYAPGRSEAHVAGLAKMVKWGGDLDPLTVMAFGQDWYLIDGHHRRAAYVSAERKVPVPVTVLKCDLKGDERVAWARVASFADNKKVHLNISGTDKADGAWLAVRDGEPGSKSELSTRYSVGPSTIANMRATKTALESGNAYMGHLYSWNTAQVERRRLERGGGETGQSDFNDKQRRLLARRLKGAMGMNPSPVLLASALEAFVPGIVMAMSQVPVDDGDGTDLEI